MPHPLTPITPYRAPDLPPSLFGQKNGTANGDRGVGDARRMPLTRSCPITLHLLHTAEEGRANKDPERVAGGLERKLFLVERENGEGADALRTDKQGSWINEG